MSIFGNRRPPGEGTALLLALLPFGSVFPALLLLLGALSPKVSHWCVKDADTLPGLLRACRNNGLLLLLAIACGFLITILVTVFAVRSLLRRGMGRFCTSTVKLALAVLVLEGLLCWGMAWKEGLLATVLDAQADLRQAEAAEGEVRTVYFAAGSAPAHLPLPYAKGQPTPLTAYQVYDEAGQWSTLYIPALLDFVPADTYCPSKDPAWNAEHVTQYQVTCTSRLGWVLNITPLS